MRKMVKAFPSPSVSQGRAGQGREQAAWVRINRFQGINHINPSIPSTDPSEGHDVCSHSLMRKRHKEKGTCSHWLAHSSVLLWLGLGCEGPGAGNSAQVSPLGARTGTSRKPEQGA